jgi:pimeloyl-ACP methyl ester carboxylesterase
MARAARTIRVDGVEIATEAFGDPTHPAVLLIMGAMASMLWWPDEFCRQLAARGRNVIRYDNRDTGLSTTWEPGKPGYTFDDMADDAVRVLDGYGLAAAHVAGMSMGGMIAQLVALEHPAQVLSLTALSTSPVGVDTSHLPQTTEAYQKHSAEAGEPDWSDRDAVIDFMVKDMHALAGPALPFDTMAARQFVKRDYDRARRFASAPNHFLLEGNEERGGRLPDLSVPLLVIHGTADPLFPVEHGEALAEAVPGARLVRLEGGGHELHEAHWPRIIAAMVEHTGRNT